MQLSGVPIQLVQIVTTGFAAARGSGNVNVDQVSHWYRAATVLPVLKSQIDTAYQAAIVVPMAAFLNVRYLQSNNFLRFAADALDADVAFPHAAAGLIAGDSMASYDSTYIELQTGLRGKSYRGSKHIGPMSESDTTAGTEDLWNAGCLARLATFAAAFLAGFTDAGGNIWLPVVYSRFLSQPRFNPTAMIVNLVTAVRVNKRIGSMRHRKVKSVY